MQESETPSAPAHLTEIQREALKAVLAHDPVWVCEHDLLKLYGLPVTRPELEQFLKNEEG
jgi:hypothetical protein